MGGSQNCISLSEILCLGANQNEWSEKTSPLSSSVINVTLFRKQLRDVGEDELHNDRLDPNFLKDGRPIKA